MGATQTPDSDSPPDVSNGRRGWLQPAEVFVLRRPDHREGSEESTRQTENCDLGAPSYAGQQPIVVYCSNASPRSDIAKRSGESSRRGLFRWANRKLKQDPSRYCD